MNRLLEREEGGEAVRYSGWRREKNTLPLEKPAYVSYTLTRSLFASYYHSPSSLLPGIGLARQLYCLYQQDKRGVYRKSRPYMRITYQLEHCFSWSEAGESSIPPPGTVDHTTRESLGKRCNNKHAADSHGTSPYLLISILDWDSGGSMHTRLCACVFYTPTHLRQTTYARARPRPCSAENRSVITYYRRSKRDNTEKDTNGG